MWWPSNHPEARSGSDRGAFRDPDLRREFLDHDQRTAR
jgi:hypothetical protein